MELVEYYIKDLCLIKGGKRLPKGHDFTNVVTDHPYIRARDIGERSIDVTKLQYISEDTFRFIRRYIVAENDICITIVGANIGDVGIIPNLLNHANLTENAVKLTKFKPTCDPVYLSYVLSTPTYKNYMETVSAGAAQPKLGLYKIEKITVLLPEIKLQNRITNILNSYDCLLDINNQRIKILEETAQQLYKEWFVRLRFPNYKKTKFEKGIPKSWKVESLAKHVTIVRGKSYTSEEIDDSKGDHPFINLKNMKRGGGFRLDGTKFFTGKFKKEQIVVPGDIVMAVTDMTQDRLIVGRVARVPLTEFKEYVISLDISKIVSLSLPNDYIYSALRFNYYGESLAEFANGTNVLHLNPELLKKESILIPDEHLINDFVLKVKPMYELMDVLAIQNEQLRQIRDRLLPRLINGKLQVKEKKELKKIELVK